MTLEPEVSDAPLSHPARDVVQPEKPKPVHRDGMPVEARCARHGCRKRPVYRLALQKARPDGAFEVIQESWICAADRDRVQIAINGAL